MSREAMQMALEALEWNYNTDLNNIPACEQWAKMLNETITALRAALAEPEKNPFGDDAERYTRKLREWRESYKALFTAPTPQPEQEPVARAWQEGYNQGVQDERTSEANIGIAGFGAKVEPARQNPYRLTAPPQREHITDGSPCWCNPDVIEEGGGNVIVHNYEDNWQQYAKPGETAQQCIERHRAEQDALMKLYATPRKPEQEPVAWWNGKETAWFEHELMGTNPPIENAIPLYTAPPQRKPLTDDEIALIVGECAASAHRYGDFSFARAVIAAYEAKNGITGEQT